MYLWATSIRHLKRKTLRNGFQHRNRLWGRGCDEAEISQEKCLFTESGQGIRCTGKAIQWRGWGHSANCRTLQINVICAHPLPDLATANAPECQPEIFWHFPLWWHLPTIPYSALLSRRILWIFFSCLPGNFALKNGGDFWWIFSGPRLPQNEAQKILEKFGEKFGAKFGAKFGTKIRKIRETFVLQLSWPNNSQLKLQTWPVATQRLLIWRACAHMPHTHTPFWNLTNGSVTLSKPKLIWNEGALLLESTLFPFIILN